MTMSDSLSASKVAASEGPSSLPEQEILRAIAGIQYGSVEVTIHDGRIVQIECREKIRLGNGEGARGSPVRPLR
jgi:hypothetical protein